MGRHERKIVKAEDPVDYDGPYAQEDITGEWYVVECYFKTKSDAKSWMLAQLKALNSDLDKPGFWRRLMGQ